MRIQLYFCTVAFLLGFADFEHLGSASGASALAGGFYHFSW